MKKLIQDLRLASSDSNIDFLHASLMSRAADTMEAILNARSPVLPADLSGHFQVFGWRFHDGGHRGLITFYICEDSSWHPKMTIDVAWLGEAQTALKMIIDSFFSLPKKLERRSYASQESRKSWIIDGKPN